MVIDDSYYKKTVGIDESRAYLSTLPEPLDWLMTNARCAQKSSYLIDSSGVNQSINHELPSVAINPQLVN
jgi:hypothetical protein